MAHLWWVFRIYNLAKKPSRVKVPPTVIGTKPTWETARNDMSRSPCDDSMEPPIGQLGTRKQ